MFSSPIVLPERQDWLIKRMQMAGYTSESSGVCFAIAHMGMQAILAEDIKSFDERLKIISDLPMENFTQKINVDILAFFDGIELYTQNHLYTHLFENNNTSTVQDGIRTSTLTLPLALETKNGGIIKACRFSGIYNAAELADYFSDFNKNHLDFPFAFIFQNAAHTLSVGYDPAQKHWLFIDANQLPTKRIVDTKILAQYIISAFSRNEVATFCSEIYVSQSHCDALKNAITIWQAQKSWKMMHAISTEKAKLKDSEDISWIYIAAECGDLSVFTALLKDSSTDPNQPHKLGATLLYIAAMHGHIDEVKTLLNSPIINPNYGLTTNGASPLFIGVQNGHYKVAHELLNDKRTEVNKTLQDNNATPLFMAAQNGDIEMVELLLKHKADMTIGLISNVEALREYAKLSHVEDDINQRLETFMNDKIKQGLAEKFTITPIEIAFIMGHSKVVERLRTELQSYTASQGFFSLSSMLSSTSLKQDASGFHHKRVKL